MIERRRGRRDRSPAGLAAEALESRAMLADYATLSGDDWVVDVASGAEQVDAFTRVGGSRLVKSGSGSLVLDRANGHSGGIFVQAGTLVVRDVAGLGQGPLTVGPGGRVVFDVGTGEVPVAGLTVAGTGVVDLGRGRVTLPPSTYSLTDVVTALKNGRAGGSWTGTSGLTTRHAGLIAGGGLGYVVHRDGSLTVGFAAAGDANLDGVVNIFDVTALAASNKLNKGTAGSWFEGDFNYDGVINNADLATLSSSPLYNAGAYAPKLPDPNQRNLTQEFVPTKVFDAKADFGAVGDNVADDTAKVQACIDAARRWGDGAIAYFPKGTYKVTATINVTGGNYLIGGASPIYTKIQGHGAVNPVVVITDPGDLRLEFIDIRHTDQLKTAIRQVSSDSTVPSRIHYDHVYLNHYGTSFVNARTFTGSSGMALEVKDLSSESVLTGYLVSPQLKGMSFDNVSDAQVLFSHIGTMGWGALRISGTEAERDGFFGILNGYTTYRIADNHSLVISDGYQEQMRPENTPDVKYITTPYMIMSGSPDLPAGRVTVSSNKFDGAGARSGLINSSSPPYETYFTVDNYHGVLSHVVSDYKNGSATFDPNKQAFKIETTGTAPFDVLLMANNYEQGPTGSGPVVEGGSNVNRHLLANWAPGLTSSANKQVPNVTNANTLPLAGQALDDFRKLGSFDLLLNYDIDSPTFPRPTAEQAATYPELPELNWQKRSDWLDVTALPASVNGGRSAVGDGIADDTAAILAACNEVRKSNGRWSTVYLPPGTYKITSTLHPTEGLSSTVDTHLYMRGHGKSTRIVWHGPENGRMFRSDSNTSSSFIGIVWDGRSIAAQGFIHDTSSGGRRETKVLHQYQAFLNFRKEGAGTAGGKPDQRYLESSSYRNCIFINCGTGLTVMQANDYMINVEGCHFYDNGIGVYANNGEFLIRNSRFFRSSQFDIMNDNSAPNSSIRRVSSVGSNAFYRRRGTPISISNDQQATLQDCYVADWKNTSFAIQNMAQGATGWDPILIFDCTFENAPSSNPPIRLDRAAQVVHSNNTWTVGGQTRTGAQLFAGQVANLQAVPHTPSVRAATHTVSFDAQGGTAPGPASKRVTAGSAYGSLATTSRLGHTFAGWWTAPGGGGTQVTDVTNVALSSAQTLYAKWAPSSVHTVTFDPQGGATPSPATASVTFNAAYGPLATTTRPDHTFEGWWTGPGGTGTLVTATTQVTTAANQTLYAKWATATAGFRYWDNSGGTANDWGGLANWSTVAAGGTNPVALPGTADVAAFSATPIAGTAQTVNLNANRSVLGLAATSAVAANVTLLGGGTNRTLTIGASGITSAGSGSLVIGSGTSGQNVSVTLAGSQRIAANGSGGISFNNTIAGTGSPTLTNAGTGTGYVGLGTLQSTVGKVVQDSATSKLGLRNNNSAFTGGVEIRKGTVMIGTHANNLGGATNVVTLGNAAGGADPATLEINDNSSPAAYPNPIVLASKTTGLLRIVLRDDTGTQTHTFSGGVTGTNDLTIENQAEGGNADDRLIFSTGAINHVGALTHVGTGSGDLVINSVIGTNVTGVIQDSRTSRLVLNGVNTYIGDTIVNAGILVVNGNAIPNAGALVINTGGRVNPSGATETVATLFFDDVQQLAGTWGSSSSTATYKNDTYFTGTGVVLVTVSPEAGELPAGDATGSSQLLLDGAETEAALASISIVSTGLVGDLPVTSAAELGPVVSALATVAQETFDTANTTQANGWIGSNATSGGHRLGWTSTAVAGAGTGGSAGGIFARSNSYSSFADSSIGQLSRADSLRLAGSFRLQNATFDGTFYLGYFDPAALVPGVAPNGFIGIEFSEPSGSATAAFRGRVVVNGAGGASSAVISLPQAATLNFDLTWTGAADGSGTLTGTVAGQTVTVTASAGMSTFRAFGLLSGGMSTANQNEKTGECLFDNLAYHKDPVTEPGPGPAPQPDPSQQSLEARAAWMIGTYRGVTIGGPSEPNGATGQKFGWADVLARLELNPDDPVPIQRFVELLTTNNINGAFMPAGAGWILTKYWDKFTPAQRDQQILPRLKALGNLLSHGTENHFLIRYVGAHLFAQLWPNETGWYDTIRKRTVSSAELLATTKTQLLKTLRSYYDKAYAEHLSPNYLPVHFYPLHALYNSVIDPELKAAANAALTYHVAEMAANFFEGATIAPYDRPAPVTLVDPQKNTTLNTHMKAVSWLYWAELMNMGSTTTATFPSAGSTAAGGEAKHFAVTAALSDWRPPALLTALARGDGILPFTLRSAAPGFGEFATGTAAHVLRTVYRDPRFAIGSANFITKIDNGLSERMGLEIVYKSTDTQNTIVAHHPYWRTNAAEYKWLSRSSPFQQNVQHDGTVISLFNIPQADPFAGRTRADWEAYRNENFNSLIQQAWIRYPKAADEVVETGGWIMLREGETYVAIRPVNGYTRDTGEFADMTVLRSSGAKNAVIMDVATVEQFPTFAAFRAAVLAAPLTVDLTTPSVTYRNVRGDTINARFNPPNYAASTISSLPSATVNGVSQVIRDPDFANAKAVIKSDPISLVDRVLTVKLPAGTMTVDWRNQMPVFQLAPADAVFTVAAGTQVDPTAHSGTTRIVKRGLGALVLDRANAHSGGTVVEAGELVIRNPVALGTGTLQVRSGARVRLDVGNRRVPIARLDLSSSGTLDLVTGSVLLAPGSYDAAAIRRMITSARTNGTWSGFGITSSSIQPGTSREVGTLVLQDGSLVVGYSAVGDANMDGSVNVQDLIQMSTSGKYGSGVADAGWWHGDFNDDGVVNLTDLINLSTSGLFGSGSYMPLKSTGSMSLQPSASPTGNVLSGLATTPTGDAIQGGLEPAAAPVKTDSAARISTALDSPTKTPPRRSVGQLAWESIANQGGLEAQRDEKPALRRLAPRRAPG